MAALLACLAFPAFAQESDIVPDSEIISWARESCQNKDFASFFGHFAQNALVRKTYTADTVKIGKLSAPKRAGKPVSGATYHDFHIQMIDYSFVSTESLEKFEKSKNWNDVVDISLDYKEIGNDTYRVDWTRAEMKNDGEGKEFVRAIGDPGAYIFEYRGGCWWLTQDLR